MADPVLPTDWGVRPILFRIGPFAAPSYEAFLLLGLVLGAAWFMFASRRSGMLPEHRIYLLVAGLTGAAIGAKLPYVAELVRAPDIAAALAGRTVLGGVLGATLAVVVVRRRLGLYEPIGNLFAPGLALGFAVGRVGCYLRGCCYGTVAHTGLGVDFGDAISRHPTQLYEAGFGLAAFGVLSMQARHSPAPGALFRALCLAYCAFRFAVEFVREVPRGVGGLTAAQWVCVLGAAYVGGLVYRRHAERISTKAGPSIVREEEDGT